MAYLTGTALETALGEDLYLRLFDDDNDEDADTDAVAQVVTRVEGRINGFLTRLYSGATMTAASTDTLTDIALALGKQLAYLRKPEFRSERGETPVQNEYNDAMRLLRDIGDGKYRLDVNGTPDTPSNVGGSVRTGTYQNATAIGEGFVKDGTGAGGF